MSADKWAREIEDLQKKESSAVQNSPSFFIMIMQFWGEKAAKTGICQPLFIHVANVHINRIFGNAQ